MNTYVLIARHIGKVSGEKIYCNNKISYLLAKGWRVVYFSCKDETTSVQDSMNYVHYAFPALTYAPECYSKREVRKTIEGIVAAIGDLGNERCIIESDSLNRAVWAELVAKRIRAKHLAILLQETHPYCEEARKFLKFKYERHELAGIACQSINHILGDVTINRRDDTRVSAFCQNSVQECEDPISPQLSKDAKFTFGSIGRLDKNCVPAILEGFKSYALLHPDDIYNLVLIGGTTGTKRICQIQEKMKECVNIHLIITGYIYPIPESLINNIDVFVSTAGSTTISYRYHKPTIKVHPNNGGPVGILGLDDLKGKTMYDVMPDTTIADCITRCIEHAGDINYIYNYYEDYYQDMYKEFDRQLAFADIVQNQDYYDENLLMKVRTSHIKGHKWHRILGHFFGAQGLNLIIGMYKKLLGL